MHVTRRQFIVLGLAGLSESVRGEEVSPSTKDSAVISAFLSALLKSPDFVWDDRIKSDSIIILHVRAPEKTGMLQDQLISDAGDHELDPELVQAIRERNVMPGTKYDGVETSFTDLKVGPPVVISDYTALQGENEWETMNRLHPKAVAWASPWLPGYSSDGNRALARCWWGPWPHGASATAELEREGTGWKVTWIELSIYA